MIHKHLFIMVTPEGVDRQKGFYAQIVCGEVGCGEVRRVYHEGNVVVVKEGLPDKE